METAKRRLESIYQHFKTNASDIENRYKTIHPSSKFSKQNLYNIEKGYTKEMSVNNATIIASVFPSLNTGWLLTGEGDMIKNDSNNKLESTPIIENEVRPVPFENYMMVEYADLSAVAGKIGFENPASLPNFKTRLVPREYEKGNYLVITVDGDSMDDGTNISIPDGTEILAREFILEHDTSLPIRNNLFVIVSKTGTVFKQIIKHDIKNGLIVCHSYNPKYQDFTLSLEDVLQIFIYRKIVSSRPLIPEIH